MSPLAFWAPIFGLVKYLRASRMSGKCMCRSGIPEPELIVEKLDENN